MKTNIYAKKIYITILKRNMHNGNFLERASQAIRHNNAQGNVEMVLQERRPPQRMEIQDRQLARRHLEEPNRLDENARQELRLEVEQQVQRRIAEIELERQQVHRREVERQRILERHEEQIAAENIAAIERRNELMEEVPAYRNRRIEEAQQNVPQEHIANFNPMSEEEIARATEAAARHAANAINHAAAANGGEVNGGIISMVFRYARRGIAFVVGLCGGKVVLFAAGTAGLIFVLFPMYGINILNNSINTMRAFAGIRPIQQPLNLVPRDNPNNLVVLARAINQIAQDNPPGPIFTIATYLIILRALFK